MANNKHAVVRIDKLGGTLDGAQLESAIFYKESDAAEIDNAQLVVLGEKLGREVYKATAPTATSTVADLYLTAGVELFYDMMSNVLPPNIGAILTPMKISGWNFEKSGVNSDSNEVAKAEASLFTQIGVNKNLFGGGEDPSASTLSICTINDQEIVFAVMRQLERWINRKLKSVSSSYKFRLNFLPVTHYNVTEMHERYLKDATYGMPTRTAALATAGYAGSDYENMTYLENEILGLSAGETPLKSSNTQSGSAGDEGGRPTNASKGEGLSDAGNVSADRQEA